MFLFLVCTRIQHAMYISAVRVDAVNVCTVCMNSSSGFDIVLALAPSFSTTHAGIKYYALSGLTNSEVDEILSFTISVEDAVVVRFSLVHSSQHCSGLVVWLYIAVA